nr:PREDICTED: glutathione S-transferase 1-like [Tribolium castaneum]|eukprot:XP_015838196.1 PREDICTED: glutathione S-transferase 1-like [Tribolium castaneum]
MCKIPIGMENKAYIFTRNKRIFIHFSFAMAPVLYVTHLTPPVRAVLMTAKTIDLDLELKKLNVEKREHKNSEFLKLNPQHTVPTLVDNDFVLWDSHAIMAYLVSKYAKDDSLYPNDLKQRAIVNQRMHFENGVAFPELLKILYPIIHDGKKTITQEDEIAADEVYSFLEAFLDGKQWITGDSVTIADYSLITTITALNVLVKIDHVVFPNLNTWMKKLEQLPVYEANRKGLDSYTTHVKLLLR